MREKFDRSSALWRVCTPPTQPCVPGIPPEEALINDTGGMDYHLPEGGVSDTTAAGRTTVSRQRNVDYRHRTEQDISDYGFTACHGGAVSRRACRRAAHAFTTKPGISRPLHANGDHFDRHLCCREIVSCDSSGVSALKEVVETGVY
jgi:hypothetical protein